MAILTRLPLATLHGESPQSHASLLISQNTALNSPSKRKAPTDEKIDPPLSKKLQYISDSYLASFLPPSTSPRPANLSQVPDAAGPYFAISDCPGWPTPKILRRSVPRAISIDIEPLPFSLEVAVRATFPSHTHGNSHDPSWSFDIYEDMPEEETMNLLQHSACTLGINDNEDCEHLGDHDKENHQLCMACRLAYIGARPPTR